MLRCCRSVPVSYNGQCESSSLTDCQQHQQLTPGFTVHPADLSVPPAWQGRSVAGPKLRLVNMAAYVDFTLPAADMFNNNAVRLIYFHRRTGRFFRGGLNQFCPKKNHFARPWGGGCSPPALPAHTPLSTSESLKIFYLRCHSENKQTDKQTDATERPTHAGIAAGVGRAFSRVCLSVCPRSQENGLSYQHQTWYIHTL